jgi:arylsulfatase A-like enzyme
LAEDLQSQGYATAAYLDGGNLLGAGGFDRGFGEFQSEGGGILEKERAIRGFLEHNKTNPFFLFVHTYRAHQPYQATPELATAIVQGYHGKLLGAGVHAAKLTRKEVMANQYLMGALNGDAIANAEDRDFLHRVYDAGVTGADQEVGKFLGLLKSAGVYDNCVIVVTSDHGEAFGEHGFYDHKDVFEENLRVPLWIRLPGGREAGRRVSGAFSQLHLMPTILGLLGIEPKVKPEGRNLAAALAGDSLPTDPVFSAWFLYERRPLGFAVRLGDHKYIDILETKQRPKFFEDKIKAPYYFDLANDPHETRNLAQGDPSQLRRAREALEAERNQWQAIRGLLNVRDGESVELDPDAVRGLRAVGYNR